MNILVTGGAGYIGSHMVYELIEKGYKPFIVDDLSTGNMSFIPKDVELLKECISSKNITNYIKENKINAVIHFAAKISVPESIANPMKYYIENTSNTNSLISSCLNANISNFIFSSTAAVYGNKALQNKIDENSVTEPENPYGHSKLLSESVLYNVSKLLNFKYVALRYFNVAGADPLFRTGQVNKNATHLIKVACETALNKRKFVEVYGNDYETEDGSGVRDYIHVSDLVEIHLLALEYLLQGNQSIVLNCGYGKGNSVFQVLNEAEKISGKKIKTRIVGRRKGDVASLIADNSLLKKKLSWSPKFQNLSKIVSDSFHWEKKFHNQKL